MPALVSDTPALIDPLDLEPCRCRQDCHIFMSWGAEAQHSV